jgi:protocatechuate 3,4-dioxygenase alpha subunit
MTAPTPSQTVGPFYGYALPFAGGGDVAPVGLPDAITVHGYVYDGAGEPIPDALLEFWQAGPDGSTAGAPGSLRRDPVTGAVIGRNGVGFTGFGRVPTDADGHYALRTLPLGARNGAAPYLSVCVFARGLLHHLFTRIYLPENVETNAADPVLASLPPQRRATLVATAERDRVYRFDIRLQAGPHEETVFLDFG